MGGEVCKPSCLGIQTLPVRLLSLAFFVSWRTSLDENASPWKDTLAMMGLKLVKLKESDQFACRNKVEIANTRVGIF